MTNWTERLLEAIDRLTSHGDSPHGPGHRLILTVDVDELERLAAEARTALAQPEPEGVGPPAAPPAPEPGEVAELVDWLNASAREWADLGEYDEGSKCHRAADILTRYAHHTIEQPAELRSGHERFAYGNGYADGWTAGRSPRPAIKPDGVGLSDEKLLDLADDCGLEKQEITTWDGESRTVDHGWECTDAQLVTFATALITRYARPAIEPVPVAERPWEREKGWRDPDGECWWCPPDGPLYWQMANPAMVYGGWLLPPHAIPVPGAEDGQP
jgi:hypothetical protein